MTRYYAVKYFDIDQIFVRIYHGNEEARRQREYAHKNLAIEKISQFFYASCRDEAENIAEKIFKDFNKDGSTILGIEAQNWLIDNNEHIQKIIESQKLWIDFPSAIARDIFLF